MGRVTDEEDRNELQPRKHTFLLSMWQEHPDSAWRASVQIAGRPERRGFATVEYLVAYLLQLTGPDAPELEGASSSPEGWS